MKKIFTKSLAAVAATTILVPAVFAETGTGSISEENMTLSSASSTKSTTPIIMVDNAEIWKMVHCQIMKNGFEWAMPTSLFANKNTCNGIGTSFSDQNKLNAQRQMVLDYIKSKQAKEESKVEDKKTENISDFRKMTLAEYKELLTKYNIILEKTKKYPKDKSTSDLEILKNINEVLKTPMPNDWKVYFIGNTLSERELKKEDIKQIDTKEELLEIYKVFENYKDKADNEIIEGTIIGSFDGNFNVKTESDGFIEKALRDARGTEILFFDKNFQKVDLGNYDINIENWEFTSLSSLNKNPQNNIAIFKSPLRENALEMVFTSQYKPKLEKVLISLEHSQTAVKFTKTVNIIPKTDNLLSHFVADMTSNEISQRIK